MPKQRKSKEEESMQMDCVRKTELSYHDVAPVQDSIEKEYYQDVSSESTTPNARTLEFNIGAAASKKYANRDLIEAIRQCVLNVLRGVVSLSKSEQRKLARYKKRLRQFVDNKPNVEIENKLYKKEVVG